MENMTTFEVANETYPKYEASAFYHNYEHYI